MEDSFILFADAKAASAAEKNADKSARPAKMARYVSNKLSSPFDMTELIRETIIAQPKAY
jgi:hypothetical protein